MTTVQQTHTGFPVQIETIIAVCIYLLAFIGFHTVTLGLALLVGWEPTWYSIYKPVAPGGLEVTFLDGFTAVTAPIAREPGIDMASLPFLIGEAPVA